MNESQSVLRDRAHGTSRVAPAQLAVTGKVSMAAVKMGVAPSHVAPAKRSTPKIRRLIANEQYFGIDASTFHTGAERLVARAGAGARRAIDGGSLAKDFGVDAVAGRSLLTTFVAGGLLQPDGTAHYRPTALLCEYAQACVVMPLTRDRARTLVERAGELAARINAAWVRNPYIIDAIAVSGSYMSRDNLLNELSLWLVLADRDRSRRSRFSISAENAKRQIGTATKAISSFVVVRAAGDRQQIPRPFALVFQASDAGVDEQPGIWNRLRDFGSRVRWRLG